MRTPISGSDFRSALILPLLTSLLLASVSVWAQAPAQKPLLSRDGGNVKPNVLLNLDESGSMAYQYMPERQFKVATYTVNFPDDDGLIMHPSDPRQYSGTHKGTVLGNTGDSSNVFQRQMRSPDVNMIYYNPEVRYKPWIKADGTRMANASFTAVRFDPINTTSPNTANLSTVGNVNTTWCTAADSAGTTTCNSAKRSYNPAIYYRLQKTSGVFKNPNTASNYDFFNLNAGTALTTFTKYPNRTDCLLAACTRAEEQQNFANWFQYYRSRLLLAQAAIPEAFVGMDNKFRLGWGRIHKGSSTVDGVSTHIVEQGVRDYNQTQTTALVDWIRDQELIGGTPLRQAVYGVGQYFMRNDNRGPWSDDPANNSSAPHKTCRRSYQVLVTDGYWNDTNAPLTLPNLGNVDGADGTTITGVGGRTFKYTAVRPYRDSESNTLADVALYFWKSDLRAGTSGIDNKVQPTADDPSFWQAMTLFTVSLGLRGQLDPAVDLPALTSGSKSWGTDKIDDLWHAAVNTRGEYFTASNPGELTAALRSAISRASERELLEAGVATAATVLEAGNRKYIPRYKTAAWTGDVEAFVLDALGQTGAKVWGAKDKLPAWNLRNIVTMDPALTVPRVQFNWSNLSVAGKTSLGLLNTGTLTDFIRGDRSNEGPSGYRERESILGDFINTNPVFAKDASDSANANIPTVGSSYGAYVNGVKKTRFGVLYVGGNDGMLHAFKETRGASPSEDGKEIFAYVPRAVYPNLANLASRTYGTTDNYHTYFVDGPLRDVDVYLTSGTTGWRNYLFGSLGAGGRGVYALDITDPTALGTNTIRWEVNSLSESELGHVLFPVEAGVLPNGKWVAVFGNGYGGASGKAFLFVVDVATGAVQKLAVAPTVSNNGLGGVAVLKNESGQIVNLYAGDLQGKLWKFEYSSAAASGFAIANGGAAMASATTSSGTVQSIIQPPVLFDHSQGGKIVVFGSGKLITEADADSSTVQTMYGIRDKQPEALTMPFTRSNLVERTISTFGGTGGASGSTFFNISGPTIDWENKRGWFIDLAVTGYPGLRTVYPPQKADARFVLFSTVSPAQNIAPCENASGRGANFLYPVETGSCSASAVFDTNGDGVVDSSDQASCGYESNADGVDAILTGSTVGEISIQNTTGQVRATLPQPPPPPPEPEPNCSSTPPVPPPGETCDPPHPPVSPATVDRTWRRIINPPIR